MHPGWYANAAVALLLQMLLLSRAFQRDLLRRYPFFYSYLAYTTFWAVALGIPSILRLPTYPKIYWRSQIAAEILRFVIAFEIFRHVFPRSSTLRARASWTLLLTLLLLASAFWMGGSDLHSNPWLDVLRKIAFSVAALIVIVLGLAHFYAVRVGRNIWGMAVGLLLFTGSELVHLAAIDLFPRWWTVWTYVHPVAFVFMLLTWTFALWNYYPNPHRPVLTEASAKELASAWHYGWSQMHIVLRRATKP